jgi:hypothetical protein
MLLFKAGPTGRRLHRLVRFLRYLVDDLNDVHALPGNTSCEDLPHDNGGAVDVDAHTLWLRQHYLGRHVLRRPRDCLGSGQH